VKWLNKLIGKKEPATDERYLPLGTREDHISVIRGGLRELLELLADPEAQRRYEVNVPIADVPGELVCMWFDDLYHPDTSCPHFPDSICFAGCFSNEERSILARFNSVYDREKRKYPEDCDVSELQASEAWRTVTEAATTALTELGWRQ
jgi:hypothetical protein